MPRTSTAREKLIATASRLFRNKGYNGVGLAELLTASSAPKGSFYHHFPGGKEQLGEASLAQSGRKIGELIETCFAASGSEREAVGRLTAAIAAHFEDSGFRAGCPLAAMAIDAMPQSQALARAGQAVLADWRDIAVRNAAIWGMADAAAQDFAQRLAIALEGAWLIARVEQSARPFGLVSWMVCGD